MAKPQSLFTSLSRSAALRREVSLRGLQFAAEENLPHALSYGTVPSVCYEPVESDASHGNFLPATYRAIQRNPAWMHRLHRGHSQAARVFPHKEQAYRQLDCAVSSDALLMNCFCYPGVWRDGRVAALLGVEAGSVPEFGVRARVPMAGGKADGTEIDMRLGNLLLEAKLSEGNFQLKTRDALKNYSHFREVFDARRLPRAGGSLRGYQLIRNVLAAHDRKASFCLLADGRRPDLIESWYEIIFCIKIFDLRMRCKVLTWQELSEVLPPRLRKFLARKYGIEGR